MALADSYNFWSAADRVGTAAAEREVVVLVVRSLDQLFDFGVLVVLDVPQSLVDGLDDVPHPLDEAGLDGLDVPHPLLFQLLDLEDELDEEPHPDDEDDGVEERDDEPHELLDEEPELRDDEPKPPELRDDEPLEKPPELRDDPPEKPPELREPPPEKLPPRPQE